VRSDNPTRAYFFNCFLLSAALSLSACSSTISRLTFEKTRRFDPVAVYIIASSQILENNDSEHNDFIVETASDFLQQLLRVKGYESRPLNTTLNREDVFTKYPLSFYINENKIAAAAKANGSASALIVYFAYTGQRPTEDRFYSDVRCSLYAWLIDSNDASVIAHSHTELNSYQRFLATYPSTTTLAADKSYQRFLEFITFAMFGGIPTRPSGPGIQANYRGAGIYTN
jgi:hypothetical protein